jgi:hypothetical protein
MTWTILIERPPEGGHGESVFAPTGEAFFGDMEAVAARLEALQAETGRCHAAEVAA